MTHDPLAERQILAVMFNRPDLISAISETVTSDDIHVEIHRKIFKALVALRLSGNIPSITNVISTLNQDHGTDKLRTDAVSQTALLDVVPDYWPDYAETIKKCAMQRHIAEIGADIAGGRLTPEEAAEKITQLASTYRLPSAVSWPPPLNLARLAMVESTPPKFLIPDWLPCGYATLFAGHGGVGKSAIALFLAVCLAMGLPFFGLHCERSRVLYLSCEDRQDVIHWRLTRICAFLGVALSDLAGWLNIVDLVGHQSILFKPNRNGKPFTDAYRQLSTMMQDNEVLMVDGISDTYDGDEIKRAEVKAFINGALALIPPDNGAVILIGHVSKPSANTGTKEGYSGSTGWHNSVRARWYLYPESQTGEDSRTERTGNLILELQKSNLGPTDKAIKFSWNEAAGMFTGKIDEGESHFDKNWREQEERNGIIGTLIKITGKDYVPAAATGQRTAYHVLSAQPEFPKSLINGTVGKRRFWRHIEQLRSMGYIEESSIRRDDYHKRCVIVPTDKAVTEYGNTANV